MNDITQNVVMCMILQSNTFTPFTHTVPIQQMTHAHTCPNERRRSAHGRNISNNSSRRHGLFRAFSIMKLCLFAVFVSLSGRFYFFPSFICVFDISINLIIQGVPLCIGHWTHLMNTSFQCFLIKKRFQCSVNVFFRATFSQLSISAIKT